MSDSRSQRLLLEQRAITALLSSKSIREASEKVGVHPDTLENWLRREDFRNAFHVERERLLNSGLSSLVRLVAQALSVVELGLEGKATKEQLASARVVLDTVSKTFGNGGVRDEVQRRIDRFGDPSRYSFDIAPKLGEYNKSKDVLPQSPIPESER